MAALGKVLVLSASAGAGHLRAAQAVERALIGMGAVREVRHIDVLEYTNKLFRHFYSKAYIEMVNTMPDVLGWLYDYLDKPWKNERRRLALDKLNTRPFVKLLQINCMARPFRRAVSASVIGSKGGWSIVDSIRCFHRSNCGLEYPPQRSPPTISLCERSSSSACARAWIVSGRSAPSTACRSRRKQRPAACACATACRASRSSCPAPGPGFGRGGGSVAARKPGARRKLRDR